MLLESKFGIGDEVWHVWGRPRRETEPCNLCQGAGKLPVVGVEEIVSCPKCYGHGERESGEQFMDYVVAAAPLTIGRVEVKVEGPTVGRDGEHGWEVDQSNMGPRSEKREERYMAIQTGIGSGTLYNVEDLFATKEEAVAEAQRRTQASRDAILRYDEVEVAEAAPS